MFIHVSGQMLDWVGNVWWMFKKGIGNSDVHWTKKDFGYNQNEMRQNFVKTESLGPGKTSLNISNFNWSFGWSLFNFCPWWWHEWKLMKFSQHLTIFPSVFNNIYHKSLGLSQNLTKKLWDFTKVYDIS